MPSAGGVTSAGTKFAVAPNGRPKIERLTGELKPLRDVIVTVEVPELPCRISSEVGLALNEKSGGSLTVSDMSILWVNDPLVPVTVKVYVAGVVVALTEIVSVDVAVPSAGGVTEVALNAVVTPSGAPETERLTAELKPFNEVTVMVEMPESP